IERYDLAQRFAPKAESPEHLRYRFWMHYAEGSFMPPLLISLVLSRLRRAPMPFFAKPIANGLVSGAMTQFVGPQLKLHSDYVESELAQRPWFAGEAFSAADIQMSFPVEAALARSGKTPRPRMQDFLERIHARPAYQRALVVGGPFDLH
ncbi:MAG: glutathione binding-like protein, partial [Luteimonas sp.]